MLGTEEKGARPLQLFRLSQLSETLRLANDFGFCFRLPRASDFFSHHGDGAAGTFLGAEPG